MKNIKMLAVASMISLGALSMVACQKTEPDIKIEKDIQGTGIGEYKGDVEPTTKSKESDKVSQNSWSESEKEFIKKYEELNPETGWEKGKWGFKEPPMEERDYYDTKMSPNKYITKITLPDGSVHAMKINEKTGSRIIYKNEKYDQLEDLAESQRTDLSNAEAIAELNTWLGIGKIVSDKMAEGIK